ncbi:MAG: tetratricopeptide repeat protein [Hyphomicrobium sp.]
MAHVSAHPAHSRLSGVATLAALITSLMLGACAGTSDLLPGGASLASSEALAQAEDDKDPKSELRKATEYWGKQYASKQSDKAAALNYAKNLKALGDKREAIVVLQNAAALHQRDPEIAGELGRLAVEFDQLTLATRMLEIADVQENPDWKVISARGTLLAKQGQHKAAIPYFERALSLAPHQQSVMNNLAMATAMSGDAKKAEDILRQAAQNGGGEPKVNQNLALVLGLQGRYDEAKLAGAATGPSEVAASNTDYVRRMVRLEPKAAPAGIPAAAVVNTATAVPAFKTEVAPTAAADLKPASVENSSGAAWQTAVAANTDHSNLKGSKP